MTKQERLQREADIYRSVLENIAENIEDLNTEPLTLGSLKWKMGIIKQRVGAALKAGEVARNSE